MFSTTTIIGRIANDITINTVTGRDGQPIEVCNFDVAVNDRNQPRDNNGRIVPQFFRVATWGQMARTCGQYLAKGRLVTVTGTVVLTTSTVNNRIYSRLELRNPQVTFMPDTVKHEATEPVQAQPVAQQPAPVAPVTPTAPVQTAATAPVQAVAASAPMSADDLPF